MQTSDQIQQLLRASFPQIGGEFIDDGPCSSDNVRSRYRLKDGSLQVLLEQNAYGGHWEATLYDYSWTLDAEEGSTPEEAISNLQVAIAQIASIHATVNALAGTNEDPMADASQALAAVREFQSDREFWIKPMGDANLE
jgi:hypothetical protein